MKEDINDKKVSAESYRGTFVGTRDYVAPEMLEDNVSGPFSDLWALGVITYQLSTGKTPWKG